MIRPTAIQGLATRQTGMSQSSTTQEVTGQPGMSAPVDVLAVWDDVIDHATNKPERNCGTLVGLRLKDSRAAIAELIEAAAEMNRLAKGPTGGVTSAEKRAICARMDAALRAAGGCRMSERRFNIKCPKCGSRDVRLAEQFSVWDDYYIRAGVLVQVDGIVRPLSTGKRFASCESPDCDHQWSIRRSIAEIEVQERAVGGQS